MKRLIPVVILLVVAGVLIWKFLPRLQNRQKAQVNEIRFSGNMEAHQSLISFKVPGRIAELFMEEGQTVAQGALLARLEDDDYRQRVSADTANVNVRKASLTLLEAGTREQEIRAAEQAVITAQADLDLRQSEEARAQKLFAKDELSAQDRDLAVTAVKRAQAALETARQRLDLARAGARSEELAVARANVEAASQGLGLSRVNLGYTRLFAPISGVVTVRQAELGEVVSLGSPVVTIADLDQMWLRAYISEVDLGRVHLGQEVSITTDTFPGKEYKGRISFIASDAEFTPKSVQTTQERVTLVYRMKVDVENHAHELKPGMPADARILLSAH